MLFNKLAKIKLFVLISRFKSTNNIFLTSQLSALKKRKNKDSPFKRSGMTYASYLTLKICLELQL